MHLPRITRIVINNFSLYKSKRQIILDFADGVMCLAGANGLGKSTFISIVSYAMTGYVLQPGRQFKSDNSISAFVQRNSGFAYKYFEGRIDEEDRDLATVTVEFVLAGNKYTVKRGFFDSSELEAFIRINEAGENTVDENKPLLEQFESFFIKDAGLASFDQYVFIQGFVLTFDESKKLLFWDADSMNRVMHLFFSVDPQKAQRADELRKDIKRYESRMRNIQWEISKTSKQLAELVNKGSISEEDKTMIQDAIDEEKSLTDSADEIRKNLSSIDLSIKQTESDFDDCVLRRFALKSEYDSAFSSLYRDVVEVDANNSVLQILKRVIVALSEDESADVSAQFEEMRCEIVNAIKNKKIESRKETMEKLKLLDQEIAEIDVVSKSIGNKLERLTEDRSKEKSKLDCIIEKLTAYREKNDEILCRKSEILQSEHQLSEINALKITIEQKTKEKEDEEDRRDKAQSQLEPLENDIKCTFTAVSQSFIPVFKAYAKSFIGMDIDIGLNQVGGVLSMFINVNGSERRERFQLSESQQYFLDIALRFALIEYSKSKDAYMLIDTPEGSLDIAYESRAGQMFADFVTKGYSVIMTANINTSHLLLRMAEQCGSERMKIERMTAWTTLSVVQQEEQTSIEQAFDAIESSLSSHVY